MVCEHLGPPELDACCHCPPATPSRPLDCLTARRLERRIVSFIVGVITVGGAIVLAVLVEQLHAVVRPDAIAQVIEQFDDGEGLFRRPVGRDFEGDGERQTIETLLMTSLMTWLCVVGVRAVRCVPEPP